MEGDHVFSLIGQFFTALLSQGPVYVVWLVGVIVAFTRMGRAPRAAGYAITALVVLFLTSLLGMVTYTFLPVVTIEEGMDPQVYGYVHRGLGCFFSLGEGLGYGLLLTAVFTGRGTAAGQTGAAYAGAKPPVL